MTDLLTYALKVNGSIVLFYLFYMLLYRRDTFWKIRRAYLLIAVLFSFLYPLLQFGEWFQNQKTVQVFASAIYMDEMMILPSQQAQTPTSLFTSENILLAVYALVAFALLFKIVTQVMSILIKSRKGQKIEYNGITMIQLDENITPFSFFHLIFINKNRHTEEELPEILTHELSHVRQRHSYDVVLSEVMTALCWFNPFAWLLKKELKQNLEFLADNQVINAGFETKKYQYLLLNISCNYVDNQLINQFNISPLKKRITMMNKQKTSRKGLIKYTLIIPVALVMLIVSNAQHVVANINETLQSKKQSPRIISIEEVKEGQPTKSSKDAKPVKMKDGRLVYDVVEIPPAFPGGDEALMNFLRENIRYPLKAQEQNIQGKVTVGFIVDETGKVIEPEVARSVHSLLDAEAIRVIKSMPAWSPGKQNGKNVSVRYYVPVSFKQQKNSSAIDVKNLEENKVIVVESVEPASDNKKVFEVAEVPPAFPGGETALMKYISDNVKYPKVAAENNIQGKVIVQFVVDNTGKVVDSKIARKVEPSLDAEALRVINSMPNWIPGKQGGQNVSVRYYVPVNFRLENGKASAGMSPRTNTPMQEPSLYIVNGKEYTKEEYVNRNDKNDKAKMGTMILEPEVAVLMYGEKAKNGVFVFSESKDEIEKIQRKATELKIKTYNSLPLIILNGKPISKKEMDKINLNTIKGARMLKGERAVSDYGEKGRGGVLILYSDK